MIVVLNLLRTAHPRTVPISVRQKPAVLEKALFSTYTLEALPFEPPGLCLPGLDNHARRSPAKTNEIQAILHEMLRGLPEAAEAVQKELKRVNSRGWHLRADPG